MDILGSNQPVKITFIVPTVGRDSLTNTINSILRQTCGEWKAIIVFDGVQPNIKIDDCRIQILYTEKKDRPKNQMNSAGYVRNYGVRYATTEWVAFVDDDDAIRNTYVETFLTEISTYNPDTVVFRMLLFETWKLTTKKILEYLDANVVCYHNYYNSLKSDEVITVNTVTPFPVINSVKLNEDDVGISFAVKKHIFESGIQFDTNKKEDFRLLKSIEMNGYKIMVSPFVTYFIRRYDYDDVNINIDDILSESSRFFINY